VGIWLTDEERRTLGALCDRLIPAEDGPGALEAGAVDYIDVLLGAFTFDPPRIWAGGPGSGRAGGPRGFEDFVPLGPLDELAWRTRIEGSSGISDREFNGPVIGYQQRYREGLASLGTGFAEATAGEQRDLMERHEEFVDLVFEHACEGMYGAPEYGGNRDLVGWRSIDFAGDVQPRGWTDTEVSNP